MPIDVQQITTNLMTHTLHIKFGYSQKIIFQEIKLSIQKLVLSIRIILLLVIILRFHVYQYISYANFSQNDMSYHHVSLKHKNHAM